MAKQVDELLIEFFGDGACRFVLKIDVSKHARRVAASGTTFGDKVEADSLVRARTPFVHELGDDNGRVGMTLIVGTNQAGGRYRSGIGSQKNERTWREF